MRSLQLSYRVHQVKQIDANLLRKAQNLYDKVVVQGSRAKSCPPEVSGIKKPLVWPAPGFTSILPWKAILLMKLFVADNTLRFSFPWDPIQPRCRPRRVSKGPQWSPSPHIGALRFRGAPGLRSPPVFGSHKCLTGPVEADGCT